MLSDPTLVLEARIRRATDSYDNYELVLNLFCDLFLNGEFATINDIPVWVQHRGRAEDLPVIVPCDSSDPWDLATYLAYRQGVPFESTGAFLTALGDLGGVLAYLFRPGPENGVQRVKWAGFTESYNDRIPMVQNRRGQLYEMWV